MYEHKWSCSYRAHVCGISKCEWRGYRDEIEAHCKDKHSDRTKIVAIEAKGVKWNFKDKITGGSYAINYRNDFYFLSWTTVCSLRQGSLVQFDVTSFSDETNNTKFTLTLVDGDTCYILKGKPPLADIWLEDDGGGDVKMFPPLLTVSVVGRTNTRRLTLDFARK
jgi:hypothetical protein